MYFILRILLVAFLLIPAARTARAAEPSPAAIGEVIDRIVARQGVNADTPGCALAIIRDGRIIFEKGYGLASLEHRVPITPKTVFNIGSISKQFAASSILLLAEEGKLSLDDNIRKYFPDFPDYGHPITIRHLLHHISGIRDYEALMVPANMPYDRNYTPEELYSFITRQRALNFVPGSEFSYSNSGYTLLALIVKKASGKSLGEFCRERIFGPLGMENSVFYEKMHAIIPNRATGHDRAGDGLVAGLLDIYTVGASNLCTTVEDLARWDANFYTPRVGGAGFPEKLQTRGVLNSGETIHYARGLNISEYRGLRTVYHNGWWAGFGASLVRFPDQRFTVICLSNTTGFNPYDLPYEIADFCLADQLKPKPAPAAAEKAVERAKIPPVDVRELARFAGTYVSDELNVTYTVTSGNGRLVLRTPVTYDFVGYHFLAAENPLVHRRDDSFGTDELTVDFVRKDGAVTGMTLGIPSVSLKLDFARK